MSALTVNTSCLLYLALENEVPLLCYGNRFRSLGSAALSMCHVACGHVDLYYEYGVHCWDIAAANIIVEEAGGVSMMPDG